MSNDVVIRLRVPKASTVSLSSATCEDCGRPHFGTTVDLYCPFCGSCAITVYPTPRA